MFEPLDSPPEITLTHLYTRGCEYAIRALQVLVTEPDRRMTVPEFCAAADIPEPFTRKMLQQLVHAGILASRRGPGGGFTFGRDPQEITLMDVVVAIEDRPRTDQCVLGNSECNDRNPCPLHHMWAPIKNASIRMLETNTIADLDRPPSKSRSTKKKQTRKKSRSNKKKRSKRS